MFDQIRRGQPEGPRCQKYSWIGMEPSSRMELDQTTSSRSPTRRPRRRRRTTPSTHSTRRIWKRTTTLDYVGSTTFTLKRWIHTQRAFKSDYHLIHAYHNIMRSIGVNFEEVWVVLLRFCILQDSNIPGNGTTDLMPLLFTLISVQYPISNTHYIQDLHAYIH